MCLGLPDLGLRDIAVARGLAEFGLLALGFRDGLADLVGVDNLSANFLALLARASMMSVVRFGLLLARVRLRVRALVCGTVFHGLGLIGGDVLTLVTVALFGLLGLLGGDCLGVVVVVVAGVAVASG